MSTIHDPTLEAEARPSAPLAAAAAELPLFDARRTAVIVAEEMMLAFGTWRTVPDAGGVEAPKADWLGSIGRRLPGRRAEKASVRAVAGYAAAAGLVGIAIGSILAQPHRAPAAHSRSTAQSLSIPQATGVAQGGVAPIPGRVAPTPPRIGGATSGASAASSRPDPIGDLYANIEARRRNPPPRRQVRRGEAWSPVCPVRSGAQRTACLATAIAQADRELRGSYERAIDIGVRTETLRQYRQTWDRLRNRDAKNPEAMVLGYRRLALEIQQSARSARLAQGERPRRRPKGFPWL